ILSLVAALSPIANGAPPQQGPGTVPPATFAPEFRLDTGAGHIEPSGACLDRLYSQWNEECKWVSVSSKTEDYTNLPSFRAMVALGWWGLPQLQRMVGETSDWMLALAIDEICGMRRPRLGGALPVDPKEAFGIFLFAEPVDPGIFTRAECDGSGIRLADSPVISAADIIRYDFVDHSMKLRAEALARLPRLTSPGTAFVVLAEGKRIYVGAFTTCASSIPISVPTIMVDRRALVTNQPPDVLVIERAYPQPSFGVGPDPRGDPRIKAALAALGKLEGMPNGAGMDHRAVDVPADTPKPVVPTR
ncbi:MAG: hypothetical protein IT577_13895, partial [Verrucomicrobiae bacterium]|nr:hypothetical protein [Verrucomicrobiae bacterium]